METPQQLPAIGAVVIDTGSKPIKQGTVRKPSSSCFQRSPKCIFSPYIKSRPNPILFGPPWLSSSPHLLTHSGPLALLLLPFPMPSPGGHTFPTAAEGEASHCRVLLPARSLPLHHWLIVAACSQGTQTMFYLGEQRKGQSTRGGLSAPPY